MPSTRLAAVRNARASSGSTSGIVLVLQVLVSLVCGAPPAIQFCSAGRSVPGGDAGRPPGGMMLLAMRRQSSECTVSLGTTRLARLGGFGPATVLTLINWFAGSLVDKSSPLGAPG